MTKNERFRNARVRSGKSQHEMAALLGVSQSYIAGLERDQAFSLKKAKTIAPHLQVDAEWLYFGDKKDIELSQKSNINQNANKNESTIGGIALNDFQDIAQVNTKLTYDENSTFPLKKRIANDEAPYLENINASAGLNFLTDNGSPTSYIKIPGAGVDAYINVFGDSMYPKYCAGEIIGVKQVQKEDLFFGHAFVIQMSDGEAYIKYIQPGKDDDHWSLESENPKYPARQFHLSKISKIFKIKTTVTKNSL